MKWIIRIPAVAAIAIVLESAGLTIGDASNSVIFGVLGIIFPLACNQILSFPTAGIDNQELVNEARKDLNSLLLSFVYVFIITAILYSEFYPDKTFCFWKICFSIHGTARYFTLYSLIYFAHNFLAIVRHRYEFEDAIRKMKADRIRNEIYRKTEQSTKNS